MAGDVAWLALDSSTLANVGGPLIALAVGAAGAMVGRRWSKRRKAVRARQARSAMAEVVIFGAPAKAGYSATEGLYQIVTGIDLETGKQVSPGLVGDVGQIKNAVLDEKNPDSIVNMLRTIKKNGNGNGHG